MYEQWRRAYPELAEELDAGINACSCGVNPADSDKAIPPFPQDYGDATRSAGAVAINAIAKANPCFLTTSADLYSSNKNYLSGAGDFSAETPEGRNFWFGIREHAMAAICNGIAYDGLFRVSAATFCVFVDYMRASIRVAALSGLPVTYILTHDSVAVGEDGPTHQPVETISGLRVIPNLDVIRPADPEETAGAWMAAMQRADGPTALILTRQKVVTLNGIPVETRREGVLKGAYIARKEQGALKAIILASGSELELALKAAEKIGEGIRVVSMPSFCRFDAQPAEYRESVLPSSCMRRVSVEAGVTDLWWKYLGCQGGSRGHQPFRLLRSRNTGAGRTRHECGQRRCRRPQGSGQINREYFPHLLSGAVPHPPGQPLFMPPRLPGKRQGRFHETPVSVTQELYPFLWKFRSFPVRISLNTRPPHISSIVRTGPGWDSGRKSPGCKQPVFISAAGTDNFRFPSWRR